MVERKSLMIKSVSYAGIFHLTEIYSIIFDFFKSKGYDWLEKVNEQIVDEKGKQTTIKLFPNKKTSDYTRNVIKIIMQFNDVTDVTVDVEGAKKSMSKGKLKISIEAFLETDYEGRMTNKPVYFFMRELFDRFVYRLYTSRAENILVEDAEHLRALLKSYLNIQ